MTFIENTDALLKILRDTIDEILPATAAWPDNAFDRMKAKNDRESLVQLAMARLGQKLGKTNQGRIVAAGLVTQVTVIRGERAKTDIAGGNLSFRSQYDHGQPESVIAMADARKEA
jgi:hypothetical protein